MIQQPQKQSKTKPVYFSGSQFFGKANFREAKFEGEVDFSAAKFSGQPNFRSEKIKQVLIMYYMREKRKLSLT